MQIKCSKCGFENQMGAIFCRQCGEKINMNEITPESLDENRNKAGAGKTVGKIVRFAVRVLIPLVILGVAAAALAPWDLPVYTAPDETTDDFKKNEGKAQLKLEVCLAAKEPRFLKPVKFSMEELNILFSRRFLKPDENKTVVWTLEHIVLSEENDRIRMLVFAKLFDVVPVVFRADGMPAAGGSPEIPLTVQVDSAFIGHLPLLYCNSFVGAQIAKFLSGNDEIKSIFGRAGSVSLDDDDLVFDFSPSENKTTNAGSSQTGAKAAPSSESSHSCADLFADQTKEAAQSKKSNRKSSKKKTTEKTED